ncbi:MAG: TetR/AcrR family transcriptional regulator [Alphaproteobacteria bacterium]|nr:TetR/AcrR family transcriptional regulator [Alphaproteobacteria bacterium]
MTQSVDAAPFKRRRGKITRERILDEALALFAQKGYDATSVRDISTAVGVSDAALYRHFAAKEDIARELFQFHFGSFAAQVRDIANEQIDFSTRIRKLTALLCDLHDRNPNAFSFILIHQHEHLRFIESDRNVFAELIILMETAIARDEILIGNAQLAAAIALGAAVQPAVFKLYGRLGGPMSQHQNEICAALHRALGVKGAALS